MIRFAPKGVVGFGLKRTFPEKKARDGMSASAPPLLEVVGPVKRYGGLVTIDRVDLRLRRGTITGVIGPNGAGKSTLIGLIGGAIAPNEDSNRLDGREVSRLPTSERARPGIGRTYQIPRPFLDMAVEENLEVANSQFNRFSGRRRRSANVLRCLIGPGVPTSPRCPRTPSRYCAAKDWRSPARLR